MALTASERRILEAVAARLIPADEHGPSAAQAGAVTYIERALEGAHAKHAATYAAGLAALDAAGFAARAPDAQDEVLRALEMSGDEADRAFFELVREHVFEGMFGDPSWGGNAGQAGWRLLDYPGPRREWTAEEQALDVRPHARR